jgi:hypothetical protein
MGSVKLVFRPGKFSRNDRQRRCAGDSTGERGPAFLLVQLQLFTQIGDSQNKMQLTQKFCISVHAARCVLARMLQPHLIRTERFRPSHSMIAYPGRPRCARHTSAGSAFFAASIAIPGFSHENITQLLMFKASLTPAEARSLAAKTRHSSRCCSSAISKNRTPMWPANWLHTGARWNWMLLPNCFPRPQKSP